MEPRDKMKVAHICKAWFQAFLVFLGSAALAGAQIDPCEPLKPIPGSSSQYKNRGNRCEGLYEEDMGAKSLALISLTLGTISYPLQRGTKLQLTVPSENETVHVRAVPKPVNVAYEMDAVLKSGASLTWPVDDVLLPEALTAQQIGVFSWRDVGSRVVYAPVRVQREGAKESINSAITLTLRPSFDAQVVKWRLARAPSWSCEVPGPWSDVDRVPVDAGETIIINIPSNAGPHCLDVAAQGSSTDWVTITLLLDLPNQ
jgi:hypothetical protein